MSVVGALRPCSPERFDHVVLNLIRNRSEEAVVARVVLGQRDSTLRDTVHVNHNEPASRACFRPSYRELDPEIARPDIQVSLNQFDDSGCRWHELSAV